eukprot:375109_1
MGAVYSYLTDENEAELPSAIKEISLMNNNEDAIKQFRDNYRRLGFAVIEMDNDFNANSKFYRSICSKWFKENTFEDKKQYSTKFSNELCKELRTKRHSGYILTENEKEYLRFKKTTDSLLFPTKQIHDEYHKLFNRWNIFTNKCIDVVFDETTNVFDNKSQTYNIESLLNQQEKDELIQRNKKYSSISVIHYFSENDEEKKDIDEKQIGKRVNEVALDAHQDTGVMTFILCSDVVGLNVLNRKTNEYIAIEQHYNSNNCCFVIAGRKMEHIFSWKKIISATWHSVKIPVDQERLSLLYFLEIQKDW